MLEGWDRRKWRPSTASKISCCSGLTRCTSSQSVEKRIRNLRCLDADLLVKSRACRQPRARCGSASALGDSFRGALETRVSRRCQCGHRVLGFLKCKERWLGRRVQNAWLPLDPVNDQVFLRDLTHLMTLHLFTSHHRGEPPPRPGIIAKHTCFRYRCCSARNLQSMVCTYAKDDNFGVHRQFCMAKNSQLSSSSFTPLCGCSSVDRASVS